MKTAYRKCSLALIALVLAWGWASPAPATIFRVKPAQTLPFYLDATPGQAAWSSNNLISATFKSAGIAASQDTVSATVSLGYSTSMPAPSTFFGDAIEPPAITGYTVNWAAMTNTSAVTNGLIALVPNVNRAYVLGSGAIDINWQYVSASGQTTNITQSFVVADYTRIRPYRIYWTEPPHFGPPINLGHRFVRFFFPPGSELAMSQRFHAPDDPINVTTNSPGLWIDDSGLLRVFGEVEGIALMQYTTTGNSTDQIGINGGMIPVEVMRPVVHTMPMYLGDEIRPQQLFYPTSTTPLTPLVDRVPRNEGQGTLFTYSRPAQGDQPERHYAIRKSVDLPWEISFYWMGRDVMGTEWPFERNWYAADWNYADAVPFIYSDDPASNKGIRTGHLDAQLMDYMEPQNGIIGSENGITGNSQVLSNGVGHALLRVSTSNDTTFLTLRAERFDGQRQWLEPVPEQIGNEILPTPTAASVRFLESGRLTHAVNLVSNELFYAEAMIQRQAGKPFTVLQVVEPAGAHTNTLLRLTVLENGRPNAVILDTDGIPHEISPQLFLASDTWHHVGIEATTNGMALYVNGRLKGRRQFADGVLRPLPTSDNVRMLYGDDLATGMLDEIRLWNQLPDETFFAENIGVFVPTNAPGLLHYIPIVPADGLMPNRVLRDYAGGVHVTYDSGVQLVIGEGGNGFTASTNYPPTLGFVYESEPYGRGYNSTFYTQGASSADDATGPIFAINEDLLCVWWMRELDVLGQQIRIPSASQVFTNHWPDQMAQIVLASGKGSAMPSRRNHGRALRILGASEAGIRIDRDLNLLTGDFTIELWFQIKNIENNDRAPFISIANDTLKLYGEYDQEPDGSARYSALVYKDANGHESVQRGPTVTTNGWNYLALVRSQGKIALYSEQDMGMVPKVHQPFPAPSSSDAKLNRVGAPFQTQSIGPQAIRHVDEVRIWNRARSTNELSADMFRTLTGSERGLISYFTFEISNRELSAYDLARRTYYPVAESLLVAPGSPTFESTLYAEDHVQAVIYHQPDTNAPGYKVNSEHAFIHQGSQGRVVHALRDDLSPLEHNRNIVMVNVTQTIGDETFYSMDLFEVVRTNETYRSFSGYHAIAGQPLNGPSPLNLLPNPNTERTGVVRGPAFRDRKLAWWAVAATDTDSSIEVHKELVMTNYYPMQADFWFPGLTAAQQPSPGAQIPWLPNPVPSLGRGTSYPTFGTPMEVTWKVDWPEQVPEMRIGQTLTKARDGLPEMWNQASVDLVWQTSTYSTNMTESVILFDPTVERGIAQISLGDYGFKDTGAGADIYTHQGLTWFNHLPPDLKPRLFYDPNRTPNLILRGEYVANPAGDDYLLVNILTADQIEEIIQLAPEDKRPAWQDAIRNGLNALTNAVIAQPNTPVDHYALLAPGSGTGYVTVAFNNSTNTDMVQPGDPIDLAVLRVVPELYVGKIIPMQDEINLLSEQMNMVYTESFGGRAGDFEFDWWVARESESGILDPDQMTPFEKMPGLTRLNLGGPGSDFNDQVNRLFRLRYRARSGTVAAGVVSTNWSAWTDVALSEGWVQRVLNAMTPFEQRMRDLYDNPVESAVSMIQLAGRPYEGPIALNMSNMDEVGLIELYTTIQDRALRLFPIDTWDVAAQKQLLLASTRLNDIYTILGNEAFADAMDPTIQFGMAVGLDSGAVFPIDYQAHAGSIFAFQNQVPTLLDEELSLLRGRGSENLLPPLHTFPYYNRLPWNFTKGITAGEVAYAVNYNIKGSTDPIISEQTAALLYPQGHGDAWGYYLMALKQYQLLLNNPLFTLGPGITVMNLGNNPLNIDYFEENKLADTAAALARTGAEILTRTRRKAWRHADTAAFPGLLDSSSEQRWGVAEWGARAGQGAYFNWLLAQSTLPAGNDMPDFVETQLTNITRRTAAALPVLSQSYALIQRELDSADSRLNPLGLSPQAVPFDISPAGIDQGRTHFEQILERAERAVGNAAASLDHAQNFSLQRRRLEEAGYNLQLELEDQEAAHRNRLIEIYGYPYPDDIGPGKTYPQGYDGPDLFHWMYFSTNNYPGIRIPEATHTLRIKEEYDRYEITLDEDVYRRYTIGVPIADGILRGVFEGLAIGSIAETSAIPFWLGALFKLSEDAAAYSLLMSSLWGNHSQVEHLYIEYHLNNDGLPVKPTHWTSRRRAQGELQNAVTDLLIQYTRYHQAQEATEDAIREYREELHLASLTLNAELTSIYFNKIAHEADIVEKKWEKLREAIEKKEAIFKLRGQATSKKLDNFADLHLIFGMAESSNFPQIAARAVGENGINAVEAVNAAQHVLEHEFANKWNILLGALESAAEGLETVNKFKEAIEEYQKVNREGLERIDDAIERAQAALVGLERTQQRIFSLRAEGERVLAEQSRTRRQNAQRIAALRYNDMALRVFQNNALRQYGTLFDMAARQTYMAAQAYAYETAMSPVDARNNPNYHFLDKIVQARAVGSFDSAGRPISAGDIGDGGLADILARLRANWEIMEGRLGFNNPATETGRFSLRRELFRILPGEAGDDAWRRTLRQHVVADLNALPEYLHYCLPFDPGDAPRQPEPGLVIPFSTDITFGRNVFGLDLAGGDNAYDSSHFATKIRSLGVWFGNYDQGSNFVGLANSPRVYLIPVGLDTMRTPDASASSATAADGSLLARWNVSDPIIDVPYPITADQLNDRNWMPLIRAEAGNAHLTRRYPSFRAYHDSGIADASEMINSSRLIGRSVWNTRWMLIIPAGTLNANRDKALDYFIDGVVGDGNGVKDILLKFKTYSHAGN